MVDRFTDKVFDLDTLDQREAEHDPESAADTKGKKKLGVFGEGKIPDDVHLIIDHIRI